MNIIIAGDGKVGMWLTRQLSTEGHTLTLIDCKQQVLDRSIELYDVMTVCGNCASLPVLEAAGIRNADVLIAATSMDEVNLLCCLTARILNPKVRNIARVRDNDYTEQINTMREKYGVDMYVSPEQLAAKEIERALKIPGSLRCDTFARGKMQIVELKVRPDTRLCNISLNDLKSIANCQFLVFSVLRNGKSITPSGDFVLQEGDRIYVTAPVDGFQQFLNRVGIYSKKVRNIIICGGSRLAIELTKVMLGSGSSVKIIENNLRKCHELAEIVPRAVIIHGDATNESLLRREGLESCDALITATGMDEVNVIISLYGTNCKVPHVITKMGHMEHVRILDDLEIGSMVYPKSVCANNIIRFVRALNNQSGAALSIHELAEGQSEALEFKIDGSCKYCDTPLKDIPMRKNTLITGIHRGAKSSIPDGNSTYSVGDRVVVVAGTDRRVNSFNEIFTR